MKPSLRFATRSERRVPPPPSRQRLRYGLTEDYFRRLVREGKLTQRAVETAYHDLSVELAMEMLELTYSTQLYGLLAYYGIPLRNPGHE